MQPLVFEPFLRPQIWGGRRLAHFGKQLPAGDLPIGESWELSGHPLHVSQVHTGDYAGTSLDQLWDHEGRELAGPNYRGPERFPLLIKLLNVEGPLSVQVHPGDRDSQRLGLSDPGKSEAWVVLEAQPGAELFAGLRPGTDRREFESRLRDGTVEACLNRLEPEVGDCLYLPSGTVHSARGGVVLVEVQPSSDATFRLHDWNRLDSRGHARPLHREKGLEVIDWNLGPLGFVKSATTLPLAGGVSVTLLLDTPKFQLNRYDMQAPWALNDLRGRMSAWVVIEGQGQLETSSQTLALSRGQTVLVPASCGPATWQLVDGPLSALCVTLGDEFLSTERTQ
jgi:mannose-6-phosphate isomerase